MSNSIGASISSCGADRRFAYTMLWIRLNFVKQVPVVPTKEADKLERQRETKIGMGQNRADSAKFPYSANQNIL